MYVGLKQPRGDGERYVTPARAAAKETRVGRGSFRFLLIGIFGITSGGGPHISVGIFRPKLTVTFLTNRG